MPDHDLPDGSYSTFNPDNLTRVPDGYPILYHVAPRARAAEILAAGLQAGTASYDFAAMAARPGCVYFAKLDLWTDGWLHEMTGRTAAGPDGPGDDLVLALDLTTIDPRRVLPDEDSFLDPRELTRFNLPEWDDANPATFGQWADEVRLGSQPGITERALSERGALAIRGSLPASALSVHVLELYRTRKLGDLTSWTSAEGLQDDLHTCDLNSAWLWDAPEGTSPGARPDNWVPTWG